MSSTPEGKVKDAIKKELARAGAYYFMPVQNGMGKPSVDFLVCSRGRFIAIEAKAPGRSPTPRQLLTLEEIKESGGATVVIDSVAMARQILPDLLAL